MALQNSTDPAEAARALEKWLQQKLPEAGDIVVSDVNTPSAAGLSAETLLFGAAWTEDGTRVAHQLVARVAPSSPGIFQHYRLDREFAVINALYNTGSVPIPKAWWYEEDSSVLGAPFLVLSRVDGRIAADDPPFTAAGWVAELPADEQGVLVENSLAGMAAIHAVDRQAAALPALDSSGADGDELITRHLEIWREYYRWAGAGESSPTIDAGFRWLEENRPAVVGPTVRNWGDARLGNQIIGDDLSVLATIDWEMVDFGTREMDLAWWIFILRHHTEGIGVPRPDGIPDREAIVAAYERISGQPVNDLHYYEVFAAVRLSAIMFRAGSLMIEIGFLPPDAPMKLNNPASQLLAGLIGFDIPDGDAQTFIGNRN